MSGENLNQKKDALDYHKNDKPGKLEIIPSTQLNSAQDLSLAYSPGVAIPCLEIEKSPETAYDYTTKGNLVAVISNGTAVLGLGNIGALASKPVMEGKSVLFKRFSEFPTMQAIAESPITFTEVLIISKILSTAKINPIASSGSPKELKISAKVIVPADGTAAAPIEATIASNTICIYSIIDRSTPAVLAMNIVANPCIMAVPSIFIVAPTGTTKEDTSFFTPRSSVTVFNVTGMVAALEDVENANKATFLIFLKNIIGFKFANIFKIIE